MKRTPKVLRVAVTAIAGVFAGVLALVAVLWASPSHEQAAWPTRRAFRRQRGGTDEPTLTDEPSTGWDSSGSEGSSTG